MKAAPCLLLLLLSFSFSANAWDYEGHRWVNQLALKSLPTNFPSFVRAPEAAERIAFLSGEPDRWRNTPDLTLKHFNSPDHFLDLDYLKDFGLKPETLSPFRYEFVAQLATARALNPTNFAPINPAENADRTKELIGFLPWTISEYYGKLKSAFSYLKAFEEAGTPEEIANAQANVIYIMGVMGHFVGDAAQPLHSTKHYNGWVGENPKGYSTRKTFHSWIDGGFIAKSGIQFSNLVTQIKPSEPLWPADPRAKGDDSFGAVMKFFRQQHTLVEPLYILEKDNKLDGKNPSEEGRKFISERMVEGGQFLGALWHSAWQQAPTDTYLRARLLDRKSKESTAKE